MGLGKTLEILSLILSHPRSAGTPDHSRSRKLIEERRALGRETPVESGATLIVAPQILISQWIEETRRHAPGLRVVHYENHYRDLQALNVGNDLIQSDVVFTTYDQLRLDIQHQSALAPSPLLEVFWWRVCLDEAQMVCDTSNKA